MPAHPVAIVHGYFHKSYAWLKRFVELCLFATDFALFFVKESVRSACSNILMWEVLQ